MEKSFILSNLVYISSTAAAVFILMQILMITDVLYALQIMRVILILRFRGHQTRKQNFILYIVRSFISGYFFDSFFFGKSFIFMETVWLKRQIVSFVFGLIIGTAIMKIIQKLERFDNYVTIVQEVYISTVVGLLFAGSYDYAMEQQFSQLQTALLFMFYFVLLDSCLDTLYDYIVNKRRTYDNLKIGAQFIPLTMAEFVVFKVFDLKQFTTMFFVSVMMNIGYNYFKWLKSQMFQKTHVE